MKPKHADSTMPRWLLPVILAGAFFQGLLFLWLMPPWQHYDEPSHFEYVWLIAHNNRLPQIGEYDQEMRRAVAASMIEHDFFRGLGYLPDLNVQDEPIPIGGFSQLDEPPLYYLLASLPVRLVNDQDVATQLYAARFVSLTLYVTSILAAYGAMAELTALHNPLRWLVPVTLVFLPGYADLMTAVNNDVAAIAAFSLFLWAGTRAIRQGARVWNLLGLLLATALCVLSKETAYLAAPLCVFVLALATSHQKKWRVVVWGAGVVAVLAVVLAAFGWGDAAMWCRATDQASGTQAEHASAPLGERVEMFLDRSYG